ncbi:type I restriction enzyme HsdR N-terminal domain-containing protein [Hymenobacter sp. BT507]|uniref:Type I restriction enzyme HsdR N-terminal domain-containing protein n=1 Tax=Hymenobacter citatus TaxID=2763506 RepID=A0ABR7MMX0_9BACT|nr:type I restriction enzyme HsdR N-terminal domain-containing protein [Hymenobacter citatus]MBC6612424.1 type I restriction enzyme HsdR N-terminal domain-containing protein [Hymenobacter citatus]
MKLSVTSSLPGEAVASDGHIFQERLYTSKPSYRRGGKSCYLCHARKRLIQATPEEAVRQAFIRFLLHEVKVPPDSLRAEVPMSYFEVGAVGRADIIIFARKRDGLDEAVAIIECKAPSLPILDSHLTQVERYDEIVGAELVIVTNGRDIRIRQRRKGAYQEIVHVPTYQQMVARTSLKLQTDLGVWLFERATHRPLSRKLITSLQDEGIVGLDTPATLHSFLVNLHGLFENEPTVTPTLTTDVLSRFHDNGPRYESYGNAAGGSWPSNYRCFLLRYRRNDYIVGLTICAKEKREHTSAQGTSAGTTMLCVSVDEGTRSHLSLQLALDRFTRCVGEQVTIWHDGTLTNGKKGPVKRQQVLAYVSKHAPDLLNEEGEIVLGHVDNAQRLLWDQPPTVSLVANLIRYALLRDEYRRLYNRRSKKTIAAP